MDAPRIQAAGRVADKNERVFARMFMGLIGVVAGCFSGILLVILQINRAEQESTQIKVKRAINGETRVRLERNPVDRWPPYLSWAYSAGPCPAGGRSRQLVLR